MIELIDGKMASFQVRYVELDKMFNGILQRTTKSGKRLVDTVNIYINLQSVYNALRRPQFEKMFEALNKKENRSAYRQLIAGVINIAAHYRLYFARNKIKTNIVYFYNEIPDSYYEYNNSSICPNYRDHWFESLHNINRWALNTIVYDMIPFMQVICGYLENVYMIETKRVESSLVPFICDMEGFLPSNMNMIVTNDVYDFQYVNHNYLVATRYFSESMLVTKRNLMKYACYRMGREWEPKRYINPLLYNFILACIGERQRSISPIPKLGFKTVYKNLMKLYDAGYIFDENTDTMNIQHLMHVLNDTNYTILKKENIATEIMSNWNAIDLATQYKQVSKTQIKKIDSQIEDKTDVAALMDINDRYFSETPLKLIELNQYNPREEIDREIFDFDDETEQAVDKHEIPTNPK